MSYLACRQDEIGFILVQVWMGVGAFNVYLILFFSLPLFGRSPNMIEILLTGT